MDASNLFARVRIGRLSADSSNTASNSKTDCRSPITPRGDLQGDSSPERGPLSSGRYISFGPFRIDQRRQELSRGGTNIKLQGKVYQALLTLLERPGEIITREDLRLRLWPDDTHVNYDANVNTTVNKLRGALGDSSENPVYIETIPKRGYCLLVRPEVSNGSENSQSFEKERPAERTEAASPIVAISRRSKFPFRIVLCVIGLILAGMLVGAGIMGLWINHLKSVTR
ncbi:MAG TPA: winged helix-turn-helix domain-containing protein [Candidatus Acidoferrum sp.]|nr:winged helix-turn-helix domain-containing protein [Candidatus Acidoferrum sp.]